MSNFNLLKFPEIADLAKEDDLFKKMIFLSLIFHISLILVLSLKALLFPSEALNLDSAIKVDLVALPDKIVEMPAAPPKSTEVKEILAPAKEAVKNPPKPVVLNTKESPKSEALKKIQKFKEQERRQKSLESIEKQVKAEEAEARAAKLAHFKETMIKGNRLSPGTALKGLNKAAFSDYIGQIRETVHEHWNTPQWLKGANLVTVVHVHIDHRGVVIKRYIEKSSGDSAFDSYALQAVDDSQPFAPPPEKFVDLVQLDGIYLNLKP